MESSVEKQLIRLFLIEDDPGDTFFIKEMISGLKLKKINSTSIEFDCADRLSTAIEKILANPVDVVLLDLALPDGIGKSSVFKLREAGINQPIVVLTNRDDEQYAKDTVRVGAQDYLLKSEVNCKMLLRSICYAIERQKLVNQLKEAIQQIDTLHGLLPICAKCKMVKDDKGYWKQIEQYVTEHTDAKFSHGYCPDCYEKEMKAFLAYQDSNPSQEENAPSFESADVAK